MERGSLLAGRYRLEVSVRTGPDGSLWRALDEILDRIVSVRVIRPGHRHTADVVDAARRAALVEDPRLMRVLDVGESDGSAYIVAEHLVGRTLQELLTGGPLPAETARRLIGEAAEALDRASARGLHHLRLTPAAIVVGPDGAVKVLGTAVEAALAGVERDEDPVGADRADAVGLVSLLYAGLTGRWPGAPDDPPGGPRAVPPADLVPDVPNDLDTLCAVTLGPHDDGPQSPGDLARQLAPWEPAVPVGQAAGRSTHPPTTALPGNAAPAGVPAGAARGAAGGGGGGGTGRPGLGGPGPGGPGLPPPGTVTSPAAAVATTPMPAPPMPAPPMPAPPMPAPPMPAPPMPAPPMPTTPMPTTGRSAASGVATSRGATSVASLDDWSLLSAPRPVSLFSAGPPTATEEVPLGPFIPPAPTSRPPRDQARLVIALVAGLVVLGLVLAIIGIHGFSSAAPLVSSTPSSSAVVAPTGPPAARSATGASSGAAADPAPAGATGSPSSTASASGSPTSPTTSPTAATVQGVQAFDPAGSDANGSTAGHVIDGDPTTTWRSSHYASADFGGLKHGLGLYLRLNSGMVTTVKVLMSGTGGTVELLTAPGPSLDGSTVVATAQAQGGVAVLTAAPPVSTNGLVLWFTRLPQQDSGEYRLIVSEVTVS